MNGSSAITILGVLSKLFDFSKPRQKEPVVASVSGPPAVSAIPYDKDFALMCLGFVAIVAIVAIFALAASRQSA